MGPAGERGRGVTALALSRGPHGARLKLRRRRLPTLRLAPPSGCGRGLRPPLHGHGCPPSPGRRNGRPPGAPLHRPSRMEPRPMGPPAPPLALAVWAATKMATTALVREGGGRRGGRPAPSAATPRPDRGWISRRRGKKAEAVQKHDERFTHDTFCRSPFMVILSVTDIRSGRRERSRRRPGGNADAYALR